MKIVDAPERLSHVQFAVTMVRVLVPGTGMLEVFVNENVRQTKLNIKTLDTNHFQLKFYCIETQA